MTLEETIRLCEQHNLSLIRVLDITNPLSIEGPSVPGWAVSRSAPNLRDWYEIDLSSFLGPVAVGKTIPEAVQAWLDIPEDER
jgi:hypothetical protein